MKKFEVGNWVVPLFEEEKKIFRVSAVGKSLEVETDEGWEIGSFSNYRLATAEELDSLTFDNGELEGEGEETPT